MTSVNDGGSGGGAAAANAFVAAMLIATAEQEGELPTGPDGFVVYWPHGCNGAFNAWTLRLFADELDRRNAAWEAQIEAHFAATGAEQSQ